MFDFSAPIETEEDARAFYIAVGCDTDGAAEGLLSHRLAEYKRIGLSSAEEDALASSEIRRICREINGGYFSDDMKKDAEDLRGRFFRCGVMTKKAPKGDGTVTVYDRPLRAANLRQIYIAMMNLVRYEMTDEERLAVSSCLAGQYDASPERCGRRGFALAAKKYGERLMASDFLRMAKQLLSEVEDRARYHDEIEKAEKTIAAVKKSIRWGKYDKAIV